MGMVLLIVIILAALATIASGVWVAIALMAALRKPNHPEADASDEDERSAV